ncbi:MAG TPA: hypothetical protein VKN18_24010 [Blastocatellia bacterium]|nr:hypothetical protein [Blastocatellia bacterium]
MTNYQAKIAAMLLTSAGILFMMSMAFQILPFNIAIFSGVACFILAGTVRRIGRARE